jgi:tRNA pseudouridine55 synthase
MSRIDGILLLDKPPGLSSNQALQQAKRLLAARKAGHTGTLDPLATGMLPLCFGEATKVAGYMQAARKEYVTTFALGATTTTADADGEILERRPVPALDPAHVDAVLGRFVGRIRQRPPAYSAIKRDGVPLYALARRGEAVEAPERDVEIFAIERVALDAAALSLRVLCGSGTYIRSLAVDVGAALGCGAHVAALRRTFVDPFAGRPMTTLDALAAGAEELLPVDAGLGGMPEVRVDAATLERLRRGQRIALDDAPTAGVFRVYGAGDARLAALAERDASGAVRPTRVLVW